MNRKTDRNIIISHEEKIIVKIDFYIGIKFLEENKCQKMFGWCVICYESHHFGCKHLILSPICLFKKYTKIKEQGKRSENIDILIK